jgi:hypothetical protein
MFHSGKCPHCKKVISRVKVETIQISAGLKESYAGVTYVCPGCQCVLAVAMDPLALNADVVSRLLKALRKGSAR